MGKKKIIQGGVYMVLIEEAIGSEQSLIGRPCIVVQNDIGNDCSPTTIIVPLTKRAKNKLPTHYLLKKEVYPFLGYDSLVLGEQIRCVDKNKRFIERKIGQINKEDLEEILKAISKNFWEDANLK